MAVPYANSAQFMEAPAVRLTAPNLSMIRDAPISAQTCDSRSGMKMIILVTHDLHGTKGVKKNIQVSNIFRADTSSEFLIIILKHAGRTRGGILGTVRVSEL